MCRLLKYLSVFYTSGHPLNCCGCHLFRCFMMFLEFYQIHIPLDVSPFRVFYSVSCILSPLSPCIRRLSHVLQCVLHLILFLTLAFVIVSRVCIVSCIIPPYCTLVFVAFSHIVQWFLHPVPLLSPCFGCILTRFTVCLALCRPIVRLRLSHFHMFYNGFESLTTKIL